MMVMMMIMIICPHLCGSHNTINLHKYQYLFLLARCGDPPKLPNQTLQEIPLRTGDPVNGKYRDGTVAFYYPCELGSGSRIISVCQASGEWTHSRCEGSRLYWLIVCIFNTDILTKYAMN